MPSKRGRHRTRPRPWPSPLTGTRAGQAARSRFLKFSGMLTSPRFRYRRLRIQRKSSCSSPVRTDPDPPGGDLPEISMVMRTFSRSDGSLSRRHTLSGVARGSFHLVKSRGCVVEFFHKRLPVRARDRPADAAQRLPDPERATAGR